MYLQHKLQRCVFPAWIVINLYQTQLKVESYYLSEDKKTTTVGLLIDCIA